MLCVKKPAERWSPGQAQSVRLLKRLLSGIEQGRIFSNSQLCTHCEQSEFQVSPSPAVSLQLILLRRLDIRLTVKNKYVKQEFSPLWPSIYGRVNLELRGNKLFTDKCMACQAVYQVLRCHNNDKRKNYCPYRNYVQQKICYIIQT